MGIREVILRSAVFLDRDGVINRNVLDPLTGHYGAPRTVKDFQLAPGVLPALCALQQAGLLLFLVSNQPNYAKGKSTLEELAAVHRRLEEELDAYDITFIEFYYCYHHPDGVVADYSGPCVCRKPSPYFLLKARDTHGISLKDSWMVGDRATDIECGRAAGVRTIRTAEDHPAKRALDEMNAEYEVNDLAEAVSTIFACRSTSGTGGAL